MRGAEDTPSRPSTSSGSATGDAAAKLNIKRKNAMRLSFMIPRVTMAVGYAR